MDVDRVSNAVSRELMAQLDMLDRIELENVTEVAYAIAVNLLRQVERIEWVAPPPALSNDDEWRWPDAAVATFT
jgi:hypothetical protein